MSSFISELGIFMNICITNTHRRMNTDTQVDAHKNRVFFGKHHQEVNHTISESFLFV